MRRSRVALVVGCLVVLVAFAYGVENRSSTTVAGQRVDCGAAISASWLVSGTPDGSSAACDPVVRRARIGVLSTMGAGALVALVGWTAMRGPRTPVSGARPRPPGQQRRRPRGPHPGHGGRTATG